MLPKPLVFLIVFIALIYNVSSNKTRPVPQWFDDAKFGVFLHWGVYSVPAYESEWFWYFWRSGHSKSLENFMSKNYRPNFTYQEFAEDFKAELFNPNEWADLLASSGAKYVVLTTKHHDGFMLWPSKYGFGWNSMDVGPKRDLVGEIAGAIRSRTKMRFGTYHSLREWYHPLFELDGKNKYKTDYFVTNKVIPESKELVELYKPDIFWSDGGIDASATYWKSREFLKWLYEESPVKDHVVANARWGLMPEGEMLGDYSTHGDNFDPGVLQKKKWECDMSIDRNSFGYRRNANIRDYRTIEELVRKLVRVVSCGGNLLMNIGPAKDGTIDAIFQERLVQMGHWLKANGEAIYFSKPWKVQNDTKDQTIWYTQRLDKDAVYASFFDWPASGILQLAQARELFVKDDTRVQLLGYKKELKWFSKNNITNITLPKKHFIEVEWTWVLKISIKNKL